jgi:hypothetical protein
MASEQKTLGKKQNQLAFVPSKDHVWLEDRWMVASLCDE